MTVCMHACAHACARVHMRASVVVVWGISVRRRGAGLVCASPPLTPHSVFLTPRPPSGTPPISSGVRRSATWRHCTPSSSGPTCSRCVHGRCKVHCVVCACIVLLRWAPIKEKKKEKKKNWAPILEPSLRAACSRRVCSGLSSCALGSRRGPVTRPVSLAYAHTQ